MSSTGSKIVPNNCKNDFEFYFKHYCWYLNEKGDVYTWGSGEMGQLGYSGKVISMMPKDREGYPFQPQPLEIDMLKNKGVYQVAGGDGHTVAVDIKGNVYSWGASACGQLGLASMKDLPTDVEGYPYQPTPRIVELLQSVKVIQIACGDAHTVALTQDGKLYSWGGGGCGQLGHPDTSAMPKDEDGCPYQPKPKLIVVLKNSEVKQVACGKAHTVAVLGNGHLYSWGAGACGQLGHPDTSSFPADEDGYPYQPIPRCVTALKPFKLIHASCGDVHTMVLTDQGEIYCFGGGSCGQLGFGNISQMPLDVDSCPFMPVPKKIESLQGVFIVSLSCGDSHSMALSREGHVYAWGEATYGQLGLDDIRDLPKNTDNKPYQPFPQKVMALTNKKIVAISCGETHTLALTDGGHLYSFGGNTCGQLGQYVKEPERQGNGRSGKKGASSYEQEIVFPKNSIESNPYSFMSNSDSPPDTPSDRRDCTFYSQSDNKDQQNNQMLDDSSNPLSTAPNLFSPQDYGIDSLCMQPKLIKSLLHRKIIKISSGGVHNICIVEPHPSSIMQDVYQSFMQSKYCDVIFKGFYSTVEVNNSNQGNGNNINQSHTTQTVVYQTSTNSFNQQMNTGQHINQHFDANNQMNYNQQQNQNIENSSDEEMKEDYDMEQNDLNQMGNFNQTIVNDQYWSQKEKTVVNTKINAHKCIIAHKSQYFAQFFIERLQNNAMNQNQIKSSVQDDKLIIDFNGSVMYEAFRKIVDYVYLDDLNVLDAVGDSTEMIEIIKLAKQYNLEQLFKACEVHFKELMVQSFDCSNLIALKYSGSTHTSHASHQKSMRKQNKQHHDTEARDVARSSGRAVQQVSQSSNAAQQNSGGSSGLMNKRNRRLQQKLNNMLQGLMFLPDGRVLIMDSELYKQTIEKSIVLDLFDGTSLNPNGSQSQLGQGHGQQQQQNSLQPQQNMLSHHYNNDFLNNSLNYNSQQQQHIQQQQQQILPQSSSAQLEEEKQPTSLLTGNNSNRIIKDSNKSSKQNQANQRKKGSTNPNDPYGNNNMSVDNTSLGVLGNNGSSANSNSNEQFNEDLSDNKKDFLSMLNNNEFSDITLIVDGNPIYCHQVVLASRSGYFEAIFSHDFKEKEQKVVNFTDVPYDTFLLLLKHIYSDSLKIDITSTTRQSQIHGHSSGNSIYDLLSLADRFSVASFKKKCEHLLAQYINVENVCQIFKYANTFNCERLKESCLLFTEENHNEVIASPGFEDLDKDEILKIIRVGKESKRRFRGRH